MARPLPEIPELSHQLVVDQSTDLLLHHPCGCFWFTCFPSDQSARRVSCFRGEWWERVKTAAEEPENSGKWWVRGWNALKRVRELSEIIAGPKWKTFIRRFNRNGRHRAGRCQYDALSYALNFDDGGPSHEAKHFYGDFSTRYAALTAKSRDLSKDAPVFTVDH